MELRHYLYQCWSDSLTHAALGGDELNNTEEYAMDLFQSRDATTIFL